jgi:hypothetical protein
MGSLALTGLPGSANPGDRLTLKITPDLAPLGGGLPAAVQDLTESEILADLDIDVGPLLAWIEKKLALDGWAKTVEFDQPITATPAELGTPSAVKKALALLIPSLLSPPSPPSVNVQGLIGELRLTKAIGAAEKIIGTITKPGLLGTPGQPTVDVRVFDETGTRLMSGNGFFQSGDFVPSLVFLPVAVASAARQPTITRTISVQVSVPFTPPGGALQTVTRDFGPFTLNLATVEVPVVALLARQALTAGAAPGHVFVGVPANSPLNSFGEVITALGPLSTVLSNVVTVLGFMGVPAPLGLTEAVRVLTFVPTASSDFRFGKGDLLGLWALFADWQFIMSAAIVLGPSTRRAFFGTILPGPTLAGFSIFPALFGVGFIPDLTISPIAAVVGTAVDNFPLPSGTYDNRLTSINFPAN